MDIRVTINEIVREITRQDISHIPSQSPLEAVGVDSLSMAELCYQIETRFRIDISNDLYQLNTLQDFVNLITRKLPKAAA